MKKAPLSWRWYLPLPFLLAGVVAYALYFYRLAGPPAEDAAMLMRYAVNLGNGDGIVFTPGMETVDGATDFFFMLCVTLLYKLGLPVIQATRLLCMAGHLATMVLVYTAMIRFFRYPVAASAGALFVGIGPGLAYAESGFGAAFFAAMAAGAAWCALAWVQGYRGRGLAAGFGLLCLLTGLTRPEGVFLAGFIAAALWLAVGWKESRPLLFSFLAWFGLAGTAYFVWHRLYFGHFLPNPWYVKGGAALSLAVVLSSLSAGMLLLKPYLPLLLPGLRGRRALRHLAFVLLPAGGFILLWAVLNQEMNYMLRYQYPAVPLLVMCWPLLWQDLGADLPVLAPWLERLRRLPWILLVLPLVAYSLWFHHARYARTARTGGNPDGRYALGQSLRSYAPKGYMMAITEAGNLPLMSGWRAMDVWGLNDKPIAHAGCVSAARLDAFRPEIIMFHDISQGTRPGTSAMSDRWLAMTDSLKAYVNRGGYTLAAAWGMDEKALHKYYVLDACPDAPALTASIRSIRYMNEATGQPCRNFAPPPSRPGP